MTSAPPVGSTPPGLGCAACRSPLRWPTDARVSVACPGCGLRYDFEGRFLRYEHKALLFDCHRRQFLLNQVLNNNATIVYAAAPGGSLSLSSRADVARFRAYLEHHAVRGRLLDVGCGLLERPGYLEFDDPEGFDFCGLDPMDDRHFFGWRVTGCAEMTPFTDAQFQTVVYATSLDHVCDLEHAARETVRILAPGGRVVVWMGDRSFGLLRRLRRRAGEVFRSLQRATGRIASSSSRTSRCFTGRPGTFDALLSDREDPRKVVRLMQRNDL